MQRKTLKNNHVRLFDEDYDSGDVYVYKVATRDYPPATMRGSDSQTTTLAYRALLRIIEVHGEAGYTIDFTTWLNTDNGNEREVCRCKILLPTSEL